MCPIPNEDQLRRPEYTGTLSPGKDASQFTWLERAVMAIESDGLLIDLLKDTDVMLTFFLPHAQALTHLPDNLYVSGGIQLRKCENLTAIGRNCRTQFLDLWGCSGLRQILPGMQIDDWLDLRGCHGLKYVAPDLVANTVYLDKGVRPEVCPEGWREVMETATTYSFVVMQKPVSTDRTTQGNPIPLISAPYPPVPGLSGVRL